MKVSISEYLIDHRANELERITIGADQTALIPFTFEGEQIEVHFCEEEEIRGYVRCNGNDCVLCSIGKKPITKILIPVYLPANRRIGVLPVSTSLQPQSLLPQLGAIKEAGTKVGLFISRENNRYTVSTSELQRDTETGEDVIAKFVRDCDKGRIDLPSVYPQYSNQQLAQVSEIARLLELKGLINNAEDSAA